MNATRLLNLPGDGKSFGCRAGVLALVALVGVAACRPAHGVTVTFDAVQDTTIWDRPGTAERNQNFNDAFDANGDRLQLQIWNNGASGSALGRRRGIVFQFDLSSLSASSTITAAKLQYYDTGAGDYQDPPQRPEFYNNTNILTFDTSASDEQLRAFNANGDVAFDRSGMHEEFVTYNSAGSSQLDRPGTPWTGQWWIFFPANPDYAILDASSMDLHLEADNAPGQYYDAGNADATTLARLNTSKNDHGFALFIAYWRPGVNTGRTFGDWESGNPIKLVLEVTGSAYPGDFDGDGDVDGADFVAWQTNFPTASGATLAQGDADGDGDVDGADFVVWQTNFPFTPNPSASPIPEPGSISLLIFGGIIAFTHQTLRRV